MFKHIIDPATGVSNGYIYTINELLIDAEKYSPQCIYIASVIKPQIIAEAIRDCQDQIQNLNDFFLANDRKTLFKIVGYEIIPVASASVLENTYIYFVCQDFEEVKVNSILYP